MPQILTPGKIRGLSATSSSQGIFTILALDHRQSFVKMLQPSNPPSVSYADVVAAKSDVVSVLSPHASAVLLDPVYSAAQLTANGALPGKTGLLVAVEETGYTGAEIARVSSLLPSWSVEKSKRMGAQAVKLLIYYHPDAGILVQKQESLVRQVIEDCRQYDLLLFLEALSYSIDPQADKNSTPFASSRPRVIAETARRLGRLGPDILKLEFPVDSEHDMNESNWLKACEAISEDITCPWTVLSGGASYDIFVKQVSAACRGGASGTIAGRAVWQEGIPLSSEQRQTWLREIGARRLDELTEIGEKYGRGWRSFFPELEKSVDEGWYLSY
jgi:tagatose 1,6-diphosphate aldolase